MALILKQEANSNVTVPPSGSGAVFLNSSDQLTIKDSAGNIATIPQFTATGNTSVFFNDAGSFGQSANLTFVKTTNTLTVTGNVAATGVLTDNLYYANGNPWDLQQPGGTNSQVQFNDNDQFGGSSNFVWNNASNTLIVTGNSNVTGNLNVTETVNANLLTGTLTTSAQPNITSVGTLSTLTTSGNAVIGGNLIVNGNITYINVETFDVEDPIISVGGGPNGAPLTSNDGKDRGLLMHYYTVAGAVDAFMGWDNSNSEFAFGSNVTTVNDVETFNAYGNVRASTFIGNVNGTTLTGTLTTAGQPNITSVGTLIGLDIGATADRANDFPNARTVSSQDNTGESLGVYSGLIGEAVGNSADANTSAVGLFGIARANGTSKATGVQGIATVTSTADTAAAVGVRGYATATHSGGYNIGVLGNAAGSGVGNYAFYVQAGGIGSIETETFWDLADNSTAALTFNSTGKANIFGIETTDNSEGIFTSGYLNVVGNVAAAGIKTDNYYYANGSPVDFQQAGGSNTQVQFNDADSFGGSAAFTFDKSTNAVSMGNTLSVTSTATAGNLSTGGTLSVTGNANVGNLGTGGLIVATGNVSGGNLTTAGVVDATGNVSGGNLTTAGQVVATGNVSGGNLTTAGALSVTGNANVGNIGASAGVFTTVDGTLTTAAQPNITSVGTLTSLDVTGNVSANYFIGNGAFLTGIDATAIQNGNANVRTFNNANVTISAAGTANVVVVTDTSVEVTGTLTATGNANVGNLSTAGSISAIGNVSGGNLTTGGVVDATGNVTGGNLITTGIVSATGNILAGNVYANSGTIGASLLTGTLTTAAQPNVTSVGTLTSLSVTGNVSAGNVDAGNLLTANYVTGTLTTAAQPNVTSVGTLTSLSVTGNVSAGNVSATDISGTTLGGTLTTAAQPNITSVGTLTSLGASGNITAPNLIANTNVITDSVINKSGNLTITANSNVTFSVTGGGVINAGNVRIVNVGAPSSDADAATKAYVDNMVSSGIHYHQPVRVESPTALNATYNNGTAGVGATLTNAGSNVALTIDGISLNVADRVLIYQQADATQNGVYVVTTVGDGSTAWVLTRASDADTYAPSTDNGLDEGSYFFVQEGVTGAGESYVCSTVGTITFGTTPINFAQFSKAPIYTAGTGLTLSTNEFSISNTTVTAGSYGSGDAVATFTVNAQGQLTAAANVAITANAANLTGTTLASNIVTSSLTTVGTLGSLSVTGNVTAGNVSATDISGTTLGGTLTTAAQPNITSVGTLTSLAVTGNITAGNVSATGISGTTLGGTLTTAAQPNVTSVGTLTSLNVSGNANVGNIGAAAGVFTTVAGSLTTAAQPNVTSVGTLTSLNVSGNANVGNIGATNFVGSGASLTNLNASNISSGTLDQARLANASLTINGSSVSLGGSVTITANTSQVLTLGSYMVESGSTFNGGSPVTVAVDATTTNTASKVVARDSNGSFAANIITATLSGAATTAGTVTTAAQPNITSVGTLTSLAVSGALTTTNITTGANTTAGSITGNWTLTAGSRFNATYADLAERYTADQPYEPGTVVLFAGEAEVSAMGVPDCHAVAGVVSTNPAYLMNAECEGEFVVDLALIGRVPCKVQGPVMKGDLLVSSEMPGYAKANNEARAGTIIGKALESYNGPTPDGIIEILVGRC